MILNFFRRRTRSIPMSLLDRRRRNSFKAVVKRFLIEYRRLHSSKIPVMYEPAEAISNDADSGFMQVDELIRNLMGPEFPFVISVTPSQHQIDMEAAVRNSLRGDIQQIQPNPTENKLNVPGVRLQESGEGGRTLQLYHGGGHVIKVLTKYPTSDSRRRTHSKNISEIVQLCRKINHARSGKNLKLTCEFINEDSTE